MHRNCNTRYPTPDMRASFASAGSRHRFRHGLIRRPGTADESMCRATDLTYPCVAPRTANIHTPITLEYRGNCKPLVLLLRKRRPCGFDSHRPLHSQDRSGDVGTRDSCQGFDPVGKSWEFESVWRRSRSLTYSGLAPVFTRTGTRGEVERLIN